MKTNKPVRQHYVPQFYLKGFANPQKDEHYLFAYNKENKKRFPTNIKKIGQENLFYSIDESETIENLFSKLDYFFSKALQRLIDTEDLTKLHPEEMEVLSHFIAIQFLRTKEKRIFHRELMEDVVEFVGKKTIPNFKGCDITPTEDYLRLLHIEFLLSNFIEFSNIIFDEMYWMLWVNYTDTPFWTSDNPCAVDNVLEPNPFGGNLGLRCKGFQMHFPISSKLLLTLIYTNLRTSDLCRAKKSEDVDLNKGLLEMSTQLDIPVVELLHEKVFVFDKNNVIFENTLQVSSSTQFIFSKNDNFSLADKFLNEYPYYKNTKRKRLSSGFPQI